MRGYKIDDELKEEMMFVEGEVRVTFEVHPHPLQCCQALSNQLLDKIDALFTSLVINPMHQNACIIPYFIIYACLIIANCSAA